jgi:hypothetical protein
MMQNDKKQQEHRVTWSRIALTFKRNNIPEINEIDFSKRQDKFTFEDPFIASFYPVS